MTRWVVALDVTIELAALSQEEAEQRAREVLRSRPGAGARIGTQRIRWVLRDEDRGNPCGPL